MRRSLTVLYSSSGRRQTACVFLLRESAMKHVLFFKRILAFLLSTILLFTLCACRQREGGASTEAQPIDSSDENTSPAPSEISSESAAPADPAALNAIKAVLQNKAEFVNTYDGKHMDIQEFIDSHYGDTLFSMEIIKFAVVDLDNDGTPEVILWERINGNDNIAFLILYYRDKVVYGYQIGYRSFNQLKADGTFYFSSSASDSGFGTLKFAENAYVTDKITYSQSYDSNGPFYDSNENPAILYFVNHERTTQDEFESAFKKQGEKPDATWYDFTDDNIETVFTDYAAVSAYEAFLQGDATVEDPKHDLSESGTVNINDLSLGLNTLHALFDMNGDGISELHLRPTTGGGYDIFTYRDSQVFLWHADLDYCSPLNNGALLYERPGGAPPHTNYMYITLDTNGNEIARVGFSKYDVVDENGLKVGVRYIYEDNDVSKETWYALTKKILSIKSDLIEWLP